MMKKLVTIAIAICIASAFADAGIMPPIDWQPMGFQYNMTLYAQVQREDGTPIDQDASILAAFDAAGECRGLISPIDGPNGRLFQMYIASNSLTEPGISLRVLDALTGEIHLIAETVDFVSDAIVPEDGIVKPMTLHVRPEIALTLASGWNLVSIPFTPTAKDMQTLLLMKPIILSESTYVRADRIEANRGYWFFDQRGRTLKLEKTEPLPPATPPKGWSLMGYTIPDDTKAFGWVNGKYMEALFPEEGKAYWIYK